MTPTYSHNYWRLLADGYTKIGQPVPPDVVEGLEAASAVKSASITEWMVVDDGGLAAARVVDQARWVKKWPKLISPNVASINIFANGLGASAQQYLDIKFDLDMAWEQMNAAHKATQAFLEMREYMDTHGRAIQQYPKQIIKEYCEAQGWLWTAKMGIGKGTTVHAAPGEVPADCLISVTGTLLPVVDNRLIVPNQVYIDNDVTRGGKRAVYGWWVR